MSPSSQGMAPVSVGGWLAVNSCGGSTGIAPVSLLAAATAHAALQNLDRRIVKATMFAVKPATPVT